MAHELGHEGFGAASAAGMDSNYGQGMGGLEIINTLAGGAKAGQQAMDYANQLYPQVAEADPWEAALRFFLKMGQDSSVPGATAVGAAFGAAPAALDYLTAKKKEKSETDRARMTAAVQLAPALKPKAKTATQLNYKSVIITRPDGTSYEDYIPTSQIANLQAKGFKVLAKTADKTGNAAKPYDVVITNETAFQTTFPNVTLPADKTIPLTSAQVSLLPMGSFEYPDASTTNKSTKPFDVEITDVTAFKTTFPSVTLPANNVISINSEDADSLPVGSFKLYNPSKTFAEKYLQQQTVVYAKNEIEAKSILADLGVKENSTEYPSLLATIITDDEELFGKPVIIADQYVNFYKPRNVDSDFSVVIRAPGGGAIPPEVTSRNAEIKALVPIQITQQQTARELIPTLEGALSILMQNPNITGAFQSATMQARNFLSSAFGFTDTELLDQKFLTALSNKLAPKMRPIGSGSTSDMEFKAYKQAILDMNNPPKTNYLTMYSLKRTTEAAVEEINLRRQLLSQGKSETYIANKILERPATIYEKFKTTDENGDDLYQEGDEAQFVIDRDRWFNSLPNGAVILNKDSRIGNKIFPLSGATLIIKGWKGDQ